MARGVTDKKNNWSDDLKPVAAQTAVCNIASPCQQRCAYIYNQAIKAIKARNLLETSVRLLQARKGRCNAFYEGFLTAFGVLLLLICLRLEQKARRFDRMSSIMVQAVDVLMILIFIKNSHIQTQNYRRYCQVEVICKKLIKSTCGENALQKILYLRRLKKSELRSMIDKITNQNRTAEVSEQSRKHSINPSVPTSKIRYSRL